MFGGAKRAIRPKGHAECSGCSLCLLVCPVWRRTHDPRMTPEGRAKALQHGATPHDLAASVDSCELCGACEPVCPEQIDLVGMTLDLRARLADQEAVDAAQARMYAASRAKFSQGAKGVVLLPGAGLQARPDALAKAATRLGATVCEDDTTDMALALAAGIAIPQARLDRFLDVVRTARTLVVEDGLWLRHLSAWLPRARLMGLGEAMSSLLPVRQQLRQTDLYVIEPRSYHRDYQRLVKHYDRLRVERGCAFNLDLQRIAIPPATQADWILKGRKVDRIVVERQDDAAPFQRLGRHPVVHVAELADH
jgi:ferredoxin